MGASNTENIINELLYELSECREDERNSKNQLLQVISIAGTIIGVCFSLSALASKLELSNDIFTQNPNHILLLLTSCVLCTAFPYIVFLGICDVLRFHYIRSLEDQLSQLVNSGKGQDSVLHWMSMSAPILTKNPQHIFETKYTFIAYLCYAIPAVASVVFGMYTIMIEFNSISDRNIIDYALVTLSSIIIALSLVLFLVVSLKADNMFKLSNNIAIEKRNKRLKVTKEGGTSSMNKDAKRIFQTILYYIYPKHKDFQKLFLIPLGAIAGIFLINGTISYELILAQKTNILIAILVVDILIYQSRYQLNDICGIQEDQEAGKKDRLPVDVLGKKCAVILSSVLILIKIFFAIYICYKKNYISLLVITALIGIAAVFYEITRLFKLDKVTFILVGLGYPLRFFSGLCVVYSTEQILSSNWWFLGTVIVAYMAFGCFSSLLPWTHEAVSEKLSKKQKFTKSYHKPLYNVIKNRNNSSNAPLNEKGEMTDPWNIAYIMSVGVLSIFAAIHFQANSLSRFVFMEIICGLIIISVYRMSASQALKYTFFSAVVIIFKCIFLFFSLGCVPWYVCICANQLFFMAVYYFIRFKFTPNYDFFKALSPLVNGKEKRKVNRGSNVK